MPESVAVHFNLEGEVNGWMGKDLNLILSCLIIVVTTSIFVGIPYLIKNTSGNLLSIPRKEYWLNTDNKERLIKILLPHLYAIGLATNLLMIYIFHQVFRFNIHAANSVSIIAVVPFLIITFGLTIHLFIRLNKSE
jgi:uncharacterized membrane protein